MRQISIIEVTSDYRGDHSDQIFKAHEYVEGETIEDLMARCLTGDQEADYVALRFIRPKLDPDDMIDGRPVPF